MVNQRKRRLEHREKSAHHWNHGQDGSYLDDLLLEKGYEVHGIIRRASTSILPYRSSLRDPHINGVEMFCITAT